MNKKRTDDWLKRLNLLFKRAEKSGRRFDLDLRSIARHVRPPTKEALAIELTERALAGHGRIIYRLVSPESKTAIAEYTTPPQLPSTLFDPTVGRELALSAEDDLKMVFQIP